MQNDDRVERAGKKPETNQWVLKETTGILSALVSSTNEELIGNLRGTFSLNKSVNHNINH